MCAAEPMHRARSLATLEPLRFGEYLRDRRLIDDHQWLAALADHWSAPQHRRIGATIVARGFLSAEVVEAEARAFHDDLDVVEVGEVSEASLEAASADAITAPVQRVRAG
jgi:hypothetical protein